MFSSSSCCFNYERKLGPASISFSAFSFAICKKRRAYIVITCIVVFLFGQIKKLSNLFSVQDVFANIFCTSLLSYQLIYSTS